MRELSLQSSSCEYTSLAGYSVCVSNLVPPVSLANRDYGELGESDSSTDGCRNLLGTLHPQPHVPTVVAHGHKRLETRPLPSSRLFLDRHDLEHLVLQCRTNEVVDDLCLFDGQREEVDVFQLLDLVVLYQSTQLCHRNPLSQEQLSSDTEHVEDLLLTSFSSGFPLPLPLPRPLRPPRPPPLPNPPRPPRPPPADPRSAIC